MSDFIKTVEQMDEQLYSKLKQALELGKWANGTKLTAEQKELTMQSIIAWEQKYLPEEQRTGYLGGQQCGSQSKQQEVDNSLFAPASGSLH